MKDKILETLKQFQHLDETSKTRTLFGGKSLNIQDITKNLKRTDISTVLNAKTDIDKEISTFVKNVRKNKNPFLIQSSKLYTQPDDSQREVAIRMALYLYRIYWLADNKKINDTQAADFEKIIDDQIQKKEILQFKGIYNVKKELEYVEPEYETLRDINQKAGDLLLPSLQYGTGIGTTVDLTPEFENGKAVDIENYMIKDTSKIQPAGIELKNIS